MTVLLRLKTGDKFKIVLEGETFFCQVKSKNYCPSVSDLEKRNGRLCRWVLTSHQRDISLTLASHDASLIEVEPM